MGFGYLRIDCSHIQRSRQTGIVFEKKVGDAVAQGDLIAKVYSQEILSEKMLTEFEKNVIMGSECKETTEILKIIR